MTFTASQAKAELQRRRLETKTAPAQLLRQAEAPPAGNLDESLDLRSFANITPAAARAELDRRKKATGNLDDKTGESGLGRKLAMGARDVVAGVGDIADFAMTPFELARYGVKAAAHKVAPKYVDEPKYGYWNSLGPAIAESIDTATGQYTAPRDSSERTMSAINRSLTSLPIGGGIGAALGKITPRVAKTLVNISHPTAGNIGATVGGAGLAQNYMENNSDASALDTLGMGIAGSVLGGYGWPLAAKGIRGAGKTLTRNPKDTIAEWVGSSTKFDPKLYQKGIDLELTPSLGMASSAKGPTEIEGLLYRHPATGEKIEKIFNQRENKLAQHLGLNEEDLVNAVEAPNHSLAKKGAAAYKEHKGKEYERLINKFQPLEKELHEQHRAIDVGNILGDIEENYRVGRKAPSELKTFNKRFPGEVYNELKKSINESNWGTSSDIEAAASRIASAKKMGLGEQTILKNFAPELKLLEESSSATPSGASYRKLIDLRNEALDKINATKPGSIEHKEANHMHNLLKNKIDDYIDIHGNVEQVALRKQANKQYSQYASRKQSNMKHYVEDLLNTDNEAGAFNKLTTNPKYMEAASKYLPLEQKKDLAEAVIATIGKQQGRFNVAHAFTKVDRWTPAVRKKYMKLLPTTTAKANFIGAMEFIGKNKAKIQKIANTSGTSFTGSTIQRYKDWIASIGKVGQATLAGGSFYAPLETLSTLILTDLAARSTAKMWTDPVFLNRINKVIKAKNARSITNNLDILLKTPSFNQLARSSTIKSLLNLDVPDDE